MSIYVAGAHQTFLNTQGRWECYSKYIEQNYFSYFLSIQCITRCLLAMAALVYWQEAIVAMSHLLVNWMWRKQLKQVSSMYLE